MQKNDFKNGIQAGEVEGLGGGVNFKIVEVIPNVSILWKRKEATPVLEQPLEIN